MWSDDMVQHRLKRGQCGNCGNQLFKTERTIVGRKKRLKPLTIPAVVLNGRCLLCHPLGDGEQGNNDGDTDRALVDDGGVPIASICTFPTEESSECESKDGSHGNWSTIASPDASRVAVCLDARSVNSNPSDRAPPPMPLQGSDRSGPLSPSSWNQQHQAAPPSGSSGKRSPIRPTTESIPSPSEAVRLMTQWGDPQILEYALHMARACAWKDERTRSQLVSAGGIEHILGAMERHPRNALIQEYACGTIFGLVHKETTGTNATTIAFRGGVNLIIDAMGNHAGRVGLQKSSCACLQNLACRNDAMREAVGVAGGVPAVLAAMRDHPGCWEIQFYACAALSNLAVRQSRNCEVVNQSGGIALIVSSLRNNPDSLKVQRAGCTALLNLAMDARCKATMVNNGGASVALAAMRRHPDSPEVQKLGCTILQSICSTGQGLETLRYEKPGETLETAAENHPEHCQELVSSIIASLRRR